MNGHPELADKFEVIVEALDVIEFSDVDEDPLVFAVVSLAWDSLSLGSG